MTTLTTALRLRGYRSADLPLLSGGWLPGELLGLPDPDRPPLADPSSVPAPAAGRPDDELCVVDGVGFVRFTELNWVHRRARLETGLLREASHLAGPLLEAALVHAFSWLNLRRVHGWYTPAGPDGVPPLRAAGLAPEAEIPQALWLDGRPVSRQIWGVSRPDTAAAVTDNATTVTDDATTGTTVPATLEQLSPDAAARLLGEAPQDAVRGFLDLDPVTQNTALLAREITRRGLTVLRHGEALLGCAVNPVQPRQATVATTSADPVALRALLSFLHTYRRCTSFTAETRAGSPVLPALEACGFTRAGVLPGHLFLTRRYHDVLVHHFTHTALEG
ncbi:hypothetical protein OG936_03080 [Streptomyces sp. NBC_00846]|uniref:GNAT family N-acetyltransferase n=1 Tax=Streptomyces sp. NBC_00846 TaxID=2975849 RepID=UPI0038674204|nr:hypothetical protein OG936_03080 [Streptomyces sp. NBC_00846]